MDLKPLKIGGKCSLDEAGIFEHIRLALLRGLPLIGQHEAHAGTAVLVGSGPSVKGQIESIRKQREAGHPIVAIKDAHDWLIGHDIVPDYAVAIDPQPERWNCFKRKQAGVRYMIASQCHPAMFDHLAGLSVFLWHLYIKGGQKYPPDSLLVTGGTTTGLRAITLFYSLGFRRFELYGYDSCVSAGELRQDGTKAGKTFPIICAGKRFESTPEMALQASEFQHCYTVMPDADIESHGEGIITAIIEERKRTAALPKQALSFVHYADENMASYRYRCAIPAKALDIRVGDKSADVVVFAKPTDFDVGVVRQIHAEGRLAIVDFCDDHFDQQCYKDMFWQCDAITCPTPAMAALIRLRMNQPGVTITIIPDPCHSYLRAPHCDGDNLLWFGNAVNYESLQRVRNDLLGHPLRVVSNVQGEIPWSLEAMPDEFARADIVLIPATATYKSANRTIEAVRNGCFVVAEPHPALLDFPGIWIGNIKEGIEWTLQNLPEAKARTLIAQEYTNAFSPDRVASAWKKLATELVCTLDAAPKIGTVG